MKMMSNYPFVSLEISKIVKGYGLEPGSWNYLSTPLYQELFDWFREEYHINIHYTTRKESFGEKEDKVYYIFTITPLVTNSKLDQNWFWSNKLIEDYYVALEDIVMQTLTLIEKGFIVKIE